MGSSKKSKKRRSSRSRSRSPDRHRERHQKRKRNERASSSGSSGSDSRSPTPRKRKREIPPEGSPAAQTEGGSAESLSIEETNKLRAKLGLKPLQVDSGPSTSSSGKSGGGETKKAEFVHAPASNLGHQREAATLREKLSLRKELRQQQSKLKKVKGLADSDSEDEDAMAWVKKSRSIEQQKQEAEKRAKALQEMDEEFGIGSIAEEVFETKPKYGSRDLRGVRVEHDVEDLTEGREVVMTLKDADVLDQEADDVLENVNLRESEKSQAYMAKKKMEEDIFDAPPSKGVLSKYDEEIEKANRGGRLGPKASFQIGEGGVVDLPSSESSRFGGSSSSAYARDKIKQRLQEVNKVGDTLSMPAPQLMSEYFTEAEMKAKFKKSKKKGGRKLRGRDLTADKDDSDKAQPVKVVIPAVEEPSYKDIEVDEDFQATLHKARKLKQRREAEEERLRQIAQDVIVKRDQEKPPPSVSDRFGEDDPRLGLVLNTTAEFARSLGGISSPEGHRRGGESKGGDLDSLPIVREEEDDMEIDNEDANSEEERSKDSSAPAKSKWSRIEGSAGESAVEKEGGKRSSGKGPSSWREKLKEPTSSGAAVVEEEPNMAIGIAGALKLAQVKGYLEQTEKTHQVRVGKLKAVNYTIDDKASMDDDSSRRGRHHMNGPLMDFKEKRDYKPSVDLEYIDDDGRKLNAKEAFRYLSHKFHGKGSGKMKTEKRMKKFEEQSETAMAAFHQQEKIDAMLDRQKEMSTPYLVLSGGGPSHIPGSLRK